MTTFKDVKFAIGVVEDNDDPWRINRCRVRCFSVHSEDRGESPTEDLPWLMALSTDNSFSPYENGTWVFCAYLDGTDYQHGFMLGAIS